jgi:hypothetical protein
MLDSKLTEAEIVRLFELWKWNFDYYRENNIPYGSEYANPIGICIADGNQKNLLAFFNDLKKLRSYIHELENAKSWFISEIAKKDEPIKFYFQQICIKFKRKLKLKIKGILGKLFRRKA